jgi:hypothetical protein
MHANGRGQGFLNCPIDPRKLPLLAGNAWFPQLPAALAHLHKVPILPYTSHILKSRTIMIYKCSSVD